MELRVLEATVEIFEGGTDWVAREDVLWKFIVNIEEMYGGVWGYI